MKFLNSLNRLVDLRDREVDRLQAEMAAQESVRQRYHGNLNRLAELCAGSGASGALPPTLALNCGGYKQAVLDLAASHRESLVRHEADMATTQRALLTASRRRESLSQVVEQHEERGRQAQRVREQKRQDELATQVWARGRK